MTSRRLPPAGDSFDSKMLSSIVLRANETIYKPLQKGSRKGHQTVDYYVFDVGIIQENLIQAEPSESSLIDDEYTDYFNPTRSPPGNEFSSLDDRADDDDEFLIPNSQDDNNGAQSVHTVSTDFTTLSIGVPKVRNKEGVQATAPISAAASTSAAAAKTVSTSTPAEYKSRKAAIVNGQFQEPPFTT